jgi:hypothetical protein
MIARALPAKSTIAVNTINKGVLIATSLLRSAEDNVRKSSVVQNEPAMVGGKRRGGFIIHQ